MCWDTHNDFINECIMSDNENISKNGWSEYGRLVLKELERLNEGQDKLREDFDKQFRELNNKITQTTNNYENASQDLNNLKEWKDKVTEVWSVSQMKQSKDEVYEQKNKWQRVVGIVIAVQIIFGVVIALTKTFGG